MRQPSEIIINAVSLETILENHLLWLNDDGGKRADLQGADLKGADLRRADLRYVSLQDADLQSANLQEADLRYTDLRRADLRYADLDFSCMPLWCGDLKAHYDDKQIIQQLYHVLSHIKYSKNASDEIKQLLTKQNLEFANRFHRVEECGKLEV